MEAQRAATLVHQLSARRDSGCKPHCVGSGNVAADDLPSLSGTRNAGAGKDMVRHCAGCGAQRRADQAWIFKAMSAEQQHDATADLTLAGGSAASPSFPSEKQKSEATSHPWAGGGSSAK